MYLLVDKANGSDTTATSGLVNIKAARILHGSATGCDKERARRMRMQADTYYFIITIINKLINKSPATEEKELPYCSKTMYNANLE